MTKENNNGDAATTTALNKQTSPKSRRARKYRYLTIDTSYGHATTTATAVKPTSSNCSATTNSNAQTRKWDTGSMSSGISSGDLSSPCECNDNEKSCSVANKEIAKDGEVQEDDNQLPVHVQDVVRKHNSSAKKTRSSAYGIPVRSSAVRPRSAYGSLHKSTTKRTSNYRDIYEYHLKHAYHHDSDHEAGDEGDNDRDGDVADDLLFGDVDDDDDEMCDTYYVSNDVLRKIRECGSSVTYYGGRVVQTSSNQTMSTNAAAANPIETYNYGNNNGGHNNVVNNNTTGNNATIMALKNPTMMTQTQTRARVREIETCCSAAAAAATTSCSSSKALSNNINNECHFHGKQLEQKKFHLIKNDNHDAEENNRRQCAVNECNHNNNYNNDGHDVDDGNNDDDDDDYGKHKAQGLKKGCNRPTDYNAGGGVTFKLVKSNSCSSRLELAGACEISDQNIDPEETEVVRKMVHHFEASAMKQPCTSSNTCNNEATLTINNQTTTAAYNEQPTKANNTKTGGGVGAGTGANQQAIEEKHHDCDIKLVTVNNHINIAKGNLIETTKKITTTTTTSNDLKDKQSQCEKDNEFLKKDEQKMYQTEAKDIYLEHNAGVGAGVGCGGGTSAKICRNKNVDLAFTFVKQTPNKSLGISNEIPKNITHVGKESLMQNKQDNVADNNTFKKLAKNVNNLSATTTTTKAGEMKIDETHKSKKDNENNNNSMSNTINKPSQIVVPIEIHRVDDNQQQQQHLQRPPKDTTKCVNFTKITDGIEKPFLAVNSSTSIIDKTVVKYYVANDKSIYEKRKYDDIEFEEFEIYDPTKDFEKLIEDEQKRHNAETAASADTQNQQQHATLSSITSSTSKASGTSSSSSTMATAKSQQTTSASTTETETDCYDSLDDKL